jgi:hypothetical protein
MRRMSLAALAIVALVLLTGVRGTGAVDQQDDWQREGRGCSEATLRGAYGLQIHGTRTAPAPAPPGTIESVIGVNIRHYDGRGNFTQIGNDKGSVSGSGPVDREGFGTYQVNEDCTGVHELHIPGVPFVVTDRFVIVDHGREVRNFTVSPAPLMVTGVSKKIGVR